MASCKQYSLDHGIPIVSIGIGSSSETTLESLATSGIYVHAPDTSTLTEICNQLSLRFRESYIITWTTTGAAGNLVHLRITVEYTGANGTWHSIGRIDVHALKQVWIHSPHVVESVFAAHCPECLRLAEGCGLCYTT